MTAWRYKFIMLGTVQAISMLTSSVLQMSIVWHLTQRTLSASVVTMATLAVYLPRAVAGLFSGGFVDKYERKRVMIYSDLLIALAAFSLVLLAMKGDIPIWLIFLVLAIRAIGTAFHTPALNAIIPSIVPKEELTNYAGFLQGFESFSSIISPALAGFLYSIWNLSSIIMLDVVGAFIAIAVSIIIKIPKNTTSQEKVKIDMIKEFKEGIAILKKHKGMTEIMFISAAYALIYFPIGSMYPVISMVYFEGNVSQSSMVELIFSLGTLLGALSLGILGKKINKALSMSVSVMVYGTGVLTSGLLARNGIYIFMALSLVMGMSLPFFFALRTAIFQSNIPEDYLGRVLSLSYSASLFTAPIGLFAGGRLSEYIGINNCFALCGALCIVLAIYVFGSGNIRRYIV